MRNETQEFPEELEDKLLAEWVSSLPEPPADLVNTTLQDLRHRPATRPKVQTGLKWHRLVPGVMLGCIGVVILSSVIFFIASKDSLQLSSVPTATAVGNLVLMPTVTSTGNSTSIISQTQTPEPAASQIAALENTAASTSVPSGATITQQGPVATFPDQAASPPTGPDTTPPTGQLKTPAASPAPHVQTGSSTTQPAASESPDLPTVRPVLPTFTARPGRPTGTTSPAIPTSGVTPVSVATAVPPTATPDAGPGPATPIVGVVTIPPPAPYTAAVSLQTFNGQIKSLTATGLTLSNLTNSFILNSATRVRINGQVSTAAALKVGDNVVIQATFNADGSLVVVQISTTVKVPPKPITQPSTGN